MKKVLIGVIALIIVFVGIDFAKKAAQAKEDRLLGGWTPKTGGKNPLWEFVPDGKAMKTSGGSSGGSGTVVQWQDWTDADWALKGDEITITPKMFRYDIEGNVVGVDYMDPLHASLVNSAEQQELVFSDGGGSFIKTTPYKREK